MDLQTLKLKRMICFRRGNTRNSVRGANVDFFRTIYGRPEKM